MFNWLWNGLKAFGALLLPSVEEAGDKVQRSGLLRVVLHVLVVLVLFILLYIVNGALKIDDLIPSPKILAPFWLPILFLIVYLMVWVFWWLWKIVVSEEEAGTYPDIEAAWHEAVLALNNKGLALGNLPLFLILGQPSGGEKAFFQASRINLKLERIPDRDASPLHVYASEQAVYLTCPGLSLMAHQARNLAKTMGTEYYKTWSTGTEEVSEAYGTMRPDEGPSFAQDIRNLAREAEKAGLTLADLNEEQRSLLYHKEREDRPYLKLLERPEQVEHCLRRLQHLCRLVVRDRHPLCPANGILVLIPFAATATEQVASDTEQLCKRDVDTARKALRLLCPRVALVCDMETATGFREFVAGFNREKRLSRMGQGCPLAPDFVHITAALPPDQLAKSLASWVCRQALPAFIYKEFDLEETPDQSTACLDKNVKLFALLDRLREREKNLGRILAHGLARGYPDPLLFGGCYLAGTGPDSGDQAFVRGVLDWLREHQDDVSWAEEVRAQETRFERLTGYIYTFIGILILLSVLVLLYTIFFSRR